jgi:hypothetical protein
MADENQEERTAKMWQAVAVDLVSIPVIGFTCRGAANLSLLAWSWPSVSTARKQWLGFMVTIRADRPGAGVFDGPSGLN